MRSAIPLLLLLAACADAAAEPEISKVETAVAVRTSAVEEGALERPIHAVGRLRATDELALSFPFGGVVSQVKVEAGDHVRKGQTLAFLDAAPAQAQLAQADQALDKATRDATRATALEGTVLATQVREDAQTGLAVAQAQRDAAAFQARRSVLVAPADGIVLDRFVEAEQTVGAGTTILSIAGKGGYELILTVPSAEAVRLAVGDAADLTVDAFPGALLKGRVIRKSGGAGALGSWSIVVGLDPVDLPLASGLVGAATLHPAAATVRSVPIDALAEADGQVGAVYGVTSDGRAVREPVVIAFVAGDRVALASGAEDLDHVISGGLAFVRDGAPVVRTPASSGKN